MEIETKDWIRIATAAKIGNVTPQTINYWKDKGQIRCIKIDDLDFVNRKDVEAVKIGKQRQREKVILSKGNKKS